MGQERASFVRAKAKTGVCHVLWEVTGGGDGYSFKKGL